MKVKYLIWLLIFIVLLVTFPVIAQDSEVDKKINPTQPLIQKTAPPPENTILGEPLSILLRIMLLLGLTITILLIIKDIVNKEITVKEFFKFNKIKWILLLLPVLFNLPFLLKQVFDPFALIGFILFIMGYYIFINVLYWLYKKFLLIGFHNFSKIKKVIISPLMILLILYSLMGFLVIVKGLTVPDPYVLIESGEWGVSGVPEKLPYHRYAIGWKSIGAIHYMDISIVNSRNRDDLVDCYGIKTKRIYETTKGDWVYFNCYLGIYIEFEEYSGLGYLT